MDLGEALGQFFVVVVVVVVMGIWGGLQNFSVCVKVVWLSGIGADEASLSDWMFFLISFSDVTIFLRVWNLAIFLTSRFSANYTRNTKSKCGSRFFGAFWLKISFICKNKFTWNIQTTAFVKISAVKSIAAWM